MPNAEARVALVIRGVMQQALDDAGVQTLQPVGTHASALGLIKQWCGIEWATGGPALSVSGANKTELLLCSALPAADLYPLGDLYASELLPWGVHELHPDLDELVRPAGSITGLDGVLRSLLDERRPADAAFADFPHIRDAVMTRLQKTRFRRARTGLVPKLGARTIGIDLHI